MAARTGIASFETAASRLPQDDVLSPCHHKPASSCFKAGIITDRTIHVYAAWLDTEGLQAEGDAMVGDAIAAEGIEYLREINRKRRVIGQKPLAV